MTDASFRLADQEVKLRDIKSFRLLAPDTLEVCVAKDGEDVAIVLRGPQAATTFEDLAKLIIN